MKVFLILLLSIIVSFSINASKIQFMGKPLGCLYSEMDQFLLSKGFKYLEEDSNIYFYQGQFGGDNTEIAVYVSPKTKLIYRLCVLYTNFQGDYKDEVFMKLLMNKKEILYEFFIKKYGNPNTVLDESIIWNVGEDGLIIIDTTENLVDTMQLIIEYVDLVLMDKAEQEILMDY